VLGSYIDPLADKVLIGCLAAALAAQGLVPAWLLALVLGRDAALVGGAFAARARAVGWRWRGFTDFFRMMPGEGAGGSAAAPRVQPLLVSKLNTGATFALAAAALASDAWGVPDADAVDACVMLVAGTTVASSFAYVQQFSAGRWRA